MDLLEMCACGSDTGSASPMGLNDLVASTRATQSNDETFGRDNALEEKVASYNDDGGATHDRGPPGGPTPPPDGEANGWKSTAFQRFETNLDTWEPGGEPHLAIVPEVSMKDFEFGYSEGNHHALSGDQTLDTSMGIAQSCEYVKQKHGDDMFAELGFRMRAGLQRYAGFNLSLRSIERFKFPAFNPFKFRAWQQSEKSRDAQATDGGRLDPQGGDHHAAEEDSSEEGLETEGTDLGGEDQGGAGNTGGNQSSQEFQLLVTLVFLGIQKLG